MGIPRFFIEILKKYRNTHFSDPDFEFHHLFMDYNAFIYPARVEFLKKNSYDDLNKLSVSKREQALANFIVKKTIDFVNEIKPTKLLYLAFDGPAPRSKMKLQRSRRYKGVKIEEYKEKLKKQFNIDEKSPSSLFNSAALSPGTTLMKKIADGLKNAADKNKFMNGKIIVIVNDTHIPGEGEHKILNFIKYIKNLKEKICVYSPDADMIVLSLQYQGDIYNLREKNPDKDDDVELYPDPNVKYIIFSINKYREALKNEFKEIKNLNEIYLSRDLIFLTFLIGNDFVKPIYFMKSNSRGSFNSILNIYKRLLKKYKVYKTKQYLVQMKTNDDVEENNIYPTINKTFLIDILKELSNSEDFKMKNQYNYILKQTSQEITNFKKDITIEDKIASYEHGMYFLPYFKINNKNKTKTSENEYIPDNPSYNPELIKMIDYNEPKDVWKNNYYKYFFNITPDNHNEYMKYKKLICKLYLKSLMYCLKYYLTGLPSWNWYYPFRVSPMPSDILYFIHDMPKYLDFKFEKGNPYYPIEQLAMILPPQNIDILPKPIRNLIENPISELAPYYPVHFEVDKIAGNKLIYSKALLPPFVDEIVRPVIKDTFKRFTKTEKERNTLKEEYDIYNNENNSINDIVYNKPRKIQI